MVHEKVGIVTIFNDNTNYGAVLQVFALQQKIKDLGYSSEVLNIEFHKVEKAGRPFRTKVNALFQMPPTKSIRKIYKKLGTILESKIIYRKEYLGLKKRAIKVFAFKSDFIESTELIPEESLTNCVFKYNKFIAGSDQIWNPQYWKPAYFLDFVSDEVLKFSYAASIGVNAYTPLQEKYSKKYLERFTGISVREYQGEKILKQYIDKAVTTVLDPTFLLSSEEWDKISIPAAISEKYIFCYFMGKDPEHRRIAEKMRDRSGNKLVTLSDGGLKKFDRNFGDIRLYEIDPGQFLGLIKGAETVLTDSFHVTALSINYRKRFYVLRRNSDADMISMNSRIYSILDLFHLNSQLISSNNEWNLDRSETQIYKESEPIIQEKIVQSLEYLRCILRM